MPVRQRLDQGRVPVLVYTDEADAATLEQLERVARLPIVHPHVAAMPDAHLGKGATVGSVIPTRGAIMPAAVGVDIGCGMTAARLDARLSDLPDKRRPLRRAIEAAVPVGQASHKPARAPEKAARALEADLRSILDAHPALREMGRHMERKWIEQLGTLGGGNHFIELCTDEDERVWIMLHSGSRGIGNAIGRHFTELAKEQTRLEGVELPDAELAWLPEGTAWFDDYVEAVDWAQRYARCNRQVMLDNIVAALAGVLPRAQPAGEVIDCHHNYVAREEHFGETLWVTRKGAIRAAEGAWGIIPGSMGACSYIVRGHAGSESLESCAHGAGRCMSRSQAKKRIGLDRFRDQTRHVECRKDRNVLDEAPDAYRDIDRVMANQSDLVTPVHTLRQFVCVKG